MCENEPDQAKGIEVSNKHSKSEQVVAEVNAAQLAAYDEMVDRQVGLTFRSQGRFTHPACFDSYDHFRSPSRSGR